LSPVAVSEADGHTQLTVTFDDTKENSLSPFFKISIPSPSRTVPQGEAAARQLTLPDEWTTRHYVNRRIPRISKLADPNKPLEIFVGLTTNLRLSYTDFDSTKLRNPLRLPQDTARVYLADYDTFLFLHWWGWFDDTLKGSGYDALPADDKIIAVGEKDRYPYFDVWPTAPFAIDGLPAVPQAWTDPPGEPVATLGGGSFDAVGAMAVDAHGFV